jgi:hypothetical protein
MYINPVHVRFISRADSKLHQALNVSYYVALCSTKSSSVEGSLIQQCRRHAMGRTTTRTLKKHGVFDNFPLGHMDCCICNWFAAWTVDSRSDVQCRY